MGLRAYMKYKPCIEISRPPTYCFRMAYAR